MAWTAYKIEVVCYFVESVRGQNLGVGEISS